MVKIAYFVDRSMYSVACGICFDLIWFGVIYGGLLLTHARVCALGCVSYIISIL
jgi:hypothetical protein